MAGDGSERSASTTFISVLMGSLSNSPRAEAHHERHHSHLGAVVGIAPRHGEDRCEQNGGADQTGRLVLDLVLDAVATNQISASDIRCRRSARAPAPSAGSAT